MTGRSATGPIYAAIGVDLDGLKDVLGMWAGDGDGESAKFWLAVLTDLKNRGVRDVFFVVCDGLKTEPLVVELGRAGGKIELRGSRSRRTASTSSVAPGLRTCRSV